MPSSLRLPRAALVAAAALLALSAAGIVAASGSALPAGQKHEASASFVAGTQLPTLAFEKTLPAE